MSLPLAPRLEIDEMSEVLRVHEIEAELILVSPGQFFMGSENRIFNESPPHLTTITEPFFLGRFPITQRQWLLVCGSNPAAFEGSLDHPVENVTWLDAVRFCALSSEKLGRSFRLPTEAEWEYACRGGTSTEFFFSPLGPFSDDSSIPAALRRELREFAWFDENSRDCTHPVGQKRPNSLGLHDMIGNVWEWCEDYWHEGYAGAPSNGEAWLNPAPARPVRCLRGGAWNMDAFRCRSCYRSWEWETMATSRIGFRIVVDA